MKTSIPEMGDRLLGGRVAELPRTQRPQPKDMPVPNELIMGEEYLGYRTNPVASQVNQ
jgi:hypothetical protein